MKHHGPPSNIMGTSHVVYCGNIHHGYHQNFRARPTCMVLQVLHEVISMKSYGGSWWSMMSREQPGSWSSMVHHHELDPWTRPIMYVTPDNPQRSSARKNTKLPQNKTYQV